MGPLEQGLETIHLREGPTIPAKETSLGRFLDILNQPRSQSKGASLRLLAILKKDAGHKLPMLKLMEASGLGVEDFAGTVTSMRQSGLIRIDKSDDTEVATLTDIGCRMAELSMD